MPITPLRLAKFFGSSVASWLNLRAGYDVETARRKFGRALERIELVKAA